MSGYSENSTSSSDDSETFISDEEKYSLERKRFNQRYKVEEKVRRSANGIIFTGYKKNDEASRVVVKQIPKNIRHDPTCNGFPNEIYFHSKAAEASSYVVKLLDWFESRSSYRIVMEKLDGFIDIFDFVTQHGAICEEDASIVIGQLVQCCLELKEAGICHRDIKDENILINPETFQIRIIDFGCASRFTKTLPSVAVGTKNFFPPEINHQKRVDTEALTVWTIGAVLYILVTGTWETDDQFQWLRDFKAERKLTFSTLALFDRIFCPDPKRRITLEEILASGWC